MELQPQNSFSDESSDGGDGDDVEMVTSIGEVRHYFSNTALTGIDLISSCYSCLVKTYLAVLGKAHQARTLEMEPHLPLQILVTKEELNH